MFWPCRAALADSASSTAQAVDGVGVSRLADYHKVDDPGARYKNVNFGAKTGPAGAACRRGARCSGYAPSVPQLTVPGRVFILHNVFTY